jgi:hypothetical protein
LQYSIFSADKPLIGLCAMQRDRSSRLSGILDRIRDLNATGKRTRHGSSKSGFAEAQATRAADQLRRDSTLSLFRPAGKQ